MSTLYNSALVPAPKPHGSDFCSHMTTVIVERFLPVKERGCAAIKKWIVTYRIGFSASLRGRAY